MIGYEERIIKIIKIIKIIIIIYYKSRLINSINTL